METHPHTHTRRLARRSLPTTWALPAVVAVAALAVNPETFAQLTPPPAVSLPGFGSVRGMAVGDMNGDSKPDVVGAQWNVGGTGVVVALGDGSGGFLSFNAFPTGPRPQSVSLADFNGDTKLDAATVNSDNTVSVALGNGAGGLGSPTTYSFAFTGGGVTRVEPGDFNNDGKTDLAATVSGPVSFSGGPGRVFILLNDGTGGLIIPSTGLAISSGGYGSSPATGLAVADFDQDGNLDVVVTDQMNQFQNNISVHVAYGNGTGGLTSPQHLAFATSFNSVNYGAYISNETQGVTVADLNGDGRRDVIVSSYKFRPGGGSLTVFANTGGRTFGAPVSYQTDIGAQVASVGDLNNDGHSDVMVSAYQDGTLNYFFNNGSGGLGALIRYPLSTGFATVLANLDGNGSGLLDVVISTQYYGAKLILNGPPPSSDTTPPVISAPADITAEATSADGAVVTFTATAEDDKDGPVTVVASPISGSTFAIGPTVVGLAASDAAGNTASASFTITVNDTSAPAIGSVTPSSATLWPPNHQMVPITVNASATDTVGVTSLKIVSVSSNEPDNGLGDGDTAGDIQITGDLTVNLRAERSGKGTGRVYTITVEARDEAGNKTTKTCTVSVPVSQGKR